MLLRLIRRSLQQSKCSAMFPWVGSSHTLSVSRTKDLNVVLLGVSFMLMFTSFQTMGNVQTTILNSASNPDSSGYVPGFTASGYTSLAIIYTMFAALNWIAPSAVALLGPRLTMMSGGLVYLLFVLQFIYPNEIMLYLCSALLGLGAAIIWTAQGNFLTVNSDSRTMDRNAGFFWAMMNSAMFFGNLFVYFQFRGLDDISSHSRTVVVTVLSIICLIGVGTLLLLRPTPWTTDNPSHPPDTPTQALTKSWQLLWTPVMILLAFNFFYTGLALTFWSGVYGTCIGNTLEFGTDAKSLVGMHGIFVGIGEVLGGLMTMVYSQAIIRRGRDSVVILGFLVHMFAFFMIFINVPDLSPMSPADPGTTYITSSAYLAVACSLFLGFGDACFNTQIYSLLGSVYPDNSSPAFALYKFVQSLAAAIAFFYSKSVTLHYQLLILSIMCVVGTGTFIKVELNSPRGSTARSSPSPGEQESLLPEAASREDEALVRNEGI